jgi:hypothetical protein
MTHYVRVVDGEVKDVWDTAPAEGVGNNGWVNAVEVRPDIISTRQRYTSHSFDLNADPVQIVWGICDITIEERKSLMKNKFKQDFRQVVDEQINLQLSDDPGEQLDVSVVETARTVMLAKEAAVDAATTHEDLDALL